MTIRVQHDIHQSYSKAVMPAAARLARVLIDVRRAQREGWHRLNLISVEGHGLPSPRTLSDVRYEYGSPK